MQCDAVCCSVLQCVAVCCSVLQCVAVCCSMLQTPHQNCAPQTLPYPQETHRRSIYIHAYINIHMHMAMCLHPVQSGSIQTHLFFTSKTNSQSHGHTVITPHTQQTTTQPRRNISTHNAEKNKATQTHTNSPTHPTTPDKAKQKQFHTLKKLPHNHTATRK